MPIATKPLKNKDEEDFEHFDEMLRHVLLRTRLTDILKMPPYMKYMKGIVTDKRKIPGVEISTILQNIHLRVEYLRN